MIIKFTESLHIVNGRGKTIKIGGSSFRPRKAEYSHHDEQGDSGYNQRSRGWIQSNKARIFKLTLKETWNRFQDIKSTSLCSLAGWYDNPIPTRFLAPIECLKISL
jgi:hypothetical protein